MKKFFMLFVMGAAVLTASAQHSVTNHKFFDNWSIGLVGGGVNPTKGNFFDDTRAVGGLEVTKQITPVFGLAFQGVSGFNTTGANTVVDNVNASVLGNINFSNWFAGYKGKPRLFEVEGVVGVGFNHYFGDNDRFTAVDPALCSGNTFTGKLGLNLNFNLGKKKAWTVGLQPAIVYDLEGARGDANTHAQFNINHSVIELMAGVTYHFKTSNGQHYFTKIKEYDQAEVDGLNAQINALRGDLNNKNGQLDAAGKKIRDLQAQVNELRNRKPVVQTVESNVKSLESIVTFRQGKTVIDASQLPNVERIATYLKNHADAKVVIKGYASPEGPLDLNNRLAKQRAEAVKSMLVKKYGIAADRIDASGQGIGDMFSEPDWNRVSIATIEQ